MVNTLIKRDLWSMDRRKEAMEKINPVLNKLIDSMADKFPHFEENPLIMPGTEHSELDKEQLIRKYVEVDVWDWCSMIVLNVLPVENKKLFNAFKKVFTEYGVKEYKKENDADSKKRKLRADFLLFGYESYKDDYISDYKVDVIFRGNLPDTCRLEYEEHYEEIVSDSFIVKNGKVMKKETTVKVICDEASMLKLPEARAWWKLVQS